MKNGVMVTGYVDSLLALRMEEFAVRKGLNRSQVIEAAIAEYVGGETS